MNQWLLAVSLALGVIGCGSHVVPECGGPGVPSIKGVDPLTATATFNAATSNRYDTYTVDFGLVGLGQVRSGSLLLENTGWGCLSIISVAAPSDAEFGPLSLTAGEVIQPGAEISIDLSFTPSDAGPRNAFVVLETDAPAAPTVTLELTGTGTTP